MNRLFINYNSSSYQFPVPSYPFINQNIFIYASYIKTKTPTHPTPNEPLSLPSICFRPTAYSSNVTYAARNFFDWISISHFRDPMRKAGSFGAKVLFTEKGAPYCSAPLITELSQIKRLCRQVAKFRAIRQKKTTTPLRIHFLQGLIEPQIYINKSRVIIFSAFILFDV